MFVFATQTVSGLEVAAFLAGLLSVWLAQRMHIANWPAAIISSVCFAFVFHDANLYANSLLQLAFIALSAYGWWNWSRGRPTSDKLRVVRTKLPATALAIAVGVAGTWLAANFLLQRTDSPAPWADAAILVFSLVAVWAQARCRIECWLVWIAVDLVAVPLYWSRALPLTTGLYLVFMLMCIKGWISWQERLR